MSHIAQYLLAQAAQQPMATVQFAAGELWRRGRMRWANSIERSLPSFQDMDAQSCFAPFLAQGAPQGADLITRFPDAAARIRVAADAICRHQFTIFHSPYHAGPRVDWHADWVTGHRWPCLPPDQMNFLRAAAGSDVKRPWELARFHHALRLGQAFALTQQESYAQEFSSQVLDWLQQNPYPRGIHWAMPMEIGIRIANLCTAGAFFSRTNVLPSDFWRQFFAALFLHGRYLALHREWNPVARGNHHLGCLVGWLHAGVLFRNLPEGRRWYDDAKAALRAEINWQVDADGVAHEGSSNYHGFVTEMFTTAALLAARLEHPAEFARTPLEALQRAWGNRFCLQLEQMFAFPAALLAGRREPPVLGDSDDARLLPLCSHDESHPLQHVLGLGRAVFGFAVSDHSHLCEQAWWLAGEAAPAQRPAQRAAQIPAAFRKSGFYFLASQRLRGSVRCGPLGVRGWANHAHCDQLSVEFALDGAPVVVDPGAYVYSADAEARNQFRSSAFHNSPVVEGAEQNRFWPALLFRIVDDTHSQMTQWAQSEPETTFSGVHTGYARLPQRVQVQRQATLDRVRHSLCICDTLVGQGRAGVVWAWQFAPGLAITQLPTEPAADRAARENFRVHSLWSAGPVALRVWFSSAAGPVAATVFDGWFAPRYGVRESAPGLRFTCRESFPLKAIFEFFPRHESSGDTA